MIARKLPPRHPRILRVDRLVEERVLPHVTPVDRSGNRRANGADPSRSGNERPPIAEARRGELHSSSVPAAGSVPRLPRPSSNTAPASFSRPEAWNPMAATAAGLRAAGGEVEVIRADVTDAIDDCEQPWSTAFEVFGRLDIAVNNAAANNVRVPLHEIDDDMFDHVIATNLRGVFVAMKHEIRAMLATGGGSIINTASAASLVAFPMMSAYVASKHAVAGITKSAALEYASRRIRVNAVAPGAVLTEMLLAGSASTPEGKARVEHATPMNRIAAPEEIAAAIVWLASDDVVVRHRGHAAGRRRICAAMTDAPGLGPVLELLQSADEMAREIGYPDPSLRAAYHRQILMLLAQAYVQVFGTNVESPDWVPHTGPLFPWGAPNHDTIYGFAPIDARGTYRVSGTQGTETIASLMFRKGGANTGQVHGATLGEIDVQSIETPQDRRFDLLISAAAARRVRGTMVCPATRDHGSRGPARDRGAGSAGRCMGARASRS